VSTRHPHTVALERWLSGHIDHEVDQHVDRCHRCAAILEELDASTDFALRSALTEAFAPPDNLTERLVAGVNAELSARQVIDVVADLFGAGIDTTRLLLTEGTDDNY